MDAVTLALIKSMAGGGSSLPPVTPEDNGKVLAVKDGAWAADSNLFLVTITNSNADQGRDEIVQAIDDGKNVFAKKGSKLYQFDHYTTTHAYFISVSTTGAVSILTIDKAKQSTETYSRLVPDFGNGDTGKILKIGNQGGSAVASWVDQSRFIVTLTPTALDYSGTMDKTVSEINAAYEAGQEIVFRIYDSSTHYFDLKVTLTATAAYDDYPVFGACGVLTEKFILFKTDVIGSTYSTAIYTLTPAS